MENLSAKTVREIAVELPVATRIFEEFRIDYCCGGRTMFLEACRNAAADPEKVSQSIQKVIETEKTNDFEWLKTTTLTNLINYIVEKHHTFTRDEIVNLSALMAKVVNKHGERNLSLFQLEKLFNELCHDLIQHLMKEEQVLFPYILELENSGEIVSMPCFGTVQNPIKMMLMEHDSAGDFLQKMREITDNYSVPEGACLSFSALYSRIEAFERDLHQHIHLENNVLFPLAAELEQKTFQIA